MSANSSWSVPKRQEPFNSNTHDVGVICALRATHQGLHTLGLSIVKGLYLVSNESASTCIYLQPQVFPYIPINQPYHSLQGVLSIIIVPRCLALLRFCGAFRFCRRFLRPLHHGCDCWPSRIKESSVYSKKQEVQVSQRYVVHAMSLDVALHECCVMSQKKLACSVVIASQWI